MSIEELLNSIDTSKMADVYCIGETFLRQFFDGYGVYLEQDDNNVRITRCPYHTWFCTGGAYVGINVWYFDNEPVCICYHPYRKSEEEYKWFSEEAYNKVGAYIKSLMKEKTIDIIDNNVLNNILEEVSSISDKENERLNIKQ